MKKLVEVAAVLVLVMFFTWAIWMISSMVVHKSTWSVDRCKKLRREFFASCMAVEPRYRCEVQWAQLSDKVFDASPEHSFSHQVDCSGNFED